MITFIQYLKESTTEPLYTCIINPDTGERRDKVSKIERSRKYGVGKWIDGWLYLHKNYIDRLPPADSNAIRTVEAYLPKNTTYNTITYNPKTGKVRFNESLNFDSAREPWSGPFIEASPDGTLKNGNTKSIWHHKWLWVLDDYKGFDVQSSYNWSKTYLATCVPRKGSLPIWLNDLKRVGLE